MAYSEFASHKSKPKEITHISYTKISSLKYLLIQYFYKVIEYHPF